MTMAGLWEAWKPKHAVDWTLSCTIITTDANLLLGAVHDRMPVILGHEDWPKWLGEDPATADELKAALAPDTTNVELIRGDENDPRLPAARLDAATLMLVLHHIPEPAKALAEVARVLKAGGLLVLVDMLAHDREGYRQQMGHVWLGFSENHTKRLLTDAGLEAIRIVALAPGTNIKGPALFVATGKKQTAPRRHDEHEAK